MPRVVEGRLHDRHDVERVGLRLGVEQLDRGEGERRERLIQSEVRRQVDREPDGAAGPVRLGQALDDSAGQQRAVGGDRLLDVPHLVGARLVVVQQQAPHRHERVAGAGDDVEQHRVGDDELRTQRLGVGRDQPVEGLLAPGDEALGRCLALHLAPLLRVVPGLGQRLEVVDLVVGRLDDDGAGGVVAGPAGATCHLVELPGAQVPLPDPVVLAERGDHHRADGDVDADAEGVGAADDLEQAGLGELLHQPSVARQHARVVHADAVPHQPRERLAEPGGEAEVADRRGDRVLVLAAGHVDAHQRLGPFERGGLGEVHDVDRCLLGVEQLGDGLVHRRRRVVEVQRDRAFGVLDQCGGASGATGEVLAQRGGVTERGRHEQELHVRQLEQRHLPGPAAVGLAVEVELVHHDLADVGSGPLTECLVGENLCGAADHGCVRIHGGVTGEHADLVGAERVAEVEELLADQRLDRRRVVRAHALAQRGHVRSERHQRLAAAGGCGEHHVRAGGELEQRLLLRRVRRQALPAGPADEGLVEPVRVTGVRGRDRAQRGGGGGHPVRVPEGPRTGPRR